MKKILGIELGSTRVKSVLIDENGKTLAVGVYDWENEYKDGIWTYSLESVDTALKECYSGLNEDYKSKNGKYITEVDAIGISAMMHGYLAFDKCDNLLVPFRTWRNTTTERAAQELTKELGVNMPQRWSATHFYQAVLNGEEHISKVEYLTTLSGYVHYRLTGEKVLGIGDASGMFPVKDFVYDRNCAVKYDLLLHKHGINKKIVDLLPTIKVAGEDAGELTEEGARFLDESGNLKSGSKFCPPEGDAGTGMVVTNSVRAKTGNVSAGTSSFVMIVLDKPLKKAYPEIDIVTTPAGLPVAMVHANNCTSEINAWAEVFNEVTELFGGKAGKDELYEKLFKVSGNSDDGVSDMFACNFLSGEPVAKVKSGQPMFLRRAGTKLSLANFMQAQIYSAVAPLNLGMELLRDENVKVDIIYGHGGFFKTDKIGQIAMSAALNSPIGVMKKSGEGGAFGIALLALYRLTKKVRETLEEFLDGKFFDEKSIIMASEEEQRKFSKFMKTYVEYLKLEQI